jgi:hypothetical protein
MNCPPEHAKLLRGERPEKPDAERVETHFLQALPQAGCKEEREPPGGCRIGFPQIPPIAPPEKGEARKRKEAGEEGIEPGADGAARTAQISGLSNFSGSLIENKARSGIRSLSGTAGGKKKEDRGKREAIRSRVQGGRVGFPQYLGDRVRETGAGSKRLRYFFDRRAGTVAMCLHRNIRRHR